MHLVDNIPDMAREFAAFERKHFDSLPERVQEVIDQNRGGSVVDLYARTAEALYAHRDELSNKASRTLLAQLASFCGANGWHNFRDGRGLAIARAAARDNDDDPLLGDSHPAPEDDPAADPMMLANRPPPASPAT
jgi:hypothetical protein